jgi:ribonuclease HI
MAIVAHFDGLCEPNPGGVATYGFVVDLKGKRIHEDCGLAGTPYTDAATNNVAEYTGAVKALEWLVSQGLHKQPAIVRGDSDLVIRQLKGEWKVKSPLLAPFHRRARELAMEFSDLRFEWVRREQNRDADALTSRAYALFRNEGQLATAAEWIKVELRVRSHPDAARPVLEKAGIKAEVTPEAGISRVVAVIEADPDALRRLLDIKRRLEAPPRQDRPRRSP